MYLATIILTQTTVTYWLMIEILELKTQWLEVRSFKATQINIFILTMDQQTLLLIGLL